MVSMVRDTSFVPAVRAAISSLMTPAGPPYCDRRLSSERVVMACRATAIFAAAPALSEPSKRPASSLATASQQLVGAWATPDDWIKFRPIITQHYRDENMKLKELISFMDKTYGFRAT